MESYLSPDHRYCLLNIFSVDSSHPQLEIWNLSSSLRVFIDSSNFSETCLVMESLAASMAKLTHEVICSAMEFCRFAICPFKILNLYAAVGGAISPLRMYRFDTKL